jgi:hypothetical protein
MSRLSDYDYRKCDDMVQKINGSEMWISAWLKTSKDGKTYMSLSVQPKEAQASTPEPQPAVDALDDSIPF